MTYDNWKTTPPEPDYYDFDDGDPAEVYWLCAHCGHKTYKDEIAEKSELHPSRCVCMPCAEEGLRL